MSIRKKPCTGCGQTLPADQYHKMSSAPDGLAYECKSCKRTRWLAYYADNVAWASLPTEERKAARKEARR